MHELSIARSIVELVEEQADNRGASVVEELELEIGHLSGVEIQTLEFALDSAIKGIRHYIEGEGQCSDCETIFPMNALFSPCPHCGSYLVKILKGKELRVKSIVIKKE